MIKVGDTFIADGRVWEVKDINEIDGATIENVVGEILTTYQINIDTSNKLTFIYEKFKNFEPRLIEWTFSFDEIKMINEIIGKVAT